MTAAEKAQQELLVSTDRALELINNAEQKAKHNLASAAADALKVTNVSNSGDHDLLIKLSTQMDRLSLDIREIKDGTTTKIENLERDKVDKKVFEELSNDIYTHREKRIRSLETKVSNFWIQSVLYIAAVVGMLVVMTLHIFNT